MTKYLVQNFPVFKIMKILNAKEKERCKIEKNEEKEKERSRRKMNRIGKSNIVKTDGTNKTRWRHKQETINK